MEKPIVIFTECPVLGGYTLTVRDNWNFKLKQVSITAAEKDAYIEHFGNEIVTYEEFFEWWKDLNNKNLTTKKVGLV
ncbi:MAG: hypothetical protein IKQ46_01010 [Bacteroidales bacterium]|jgi:hypothetical protein|nr:hypothetical protein [Bacteroidales bacterium]